MEKQKLKNATVVLVLGILSILICCCYGIFGLVLGGVAIFLAQKDLNLYKQNPELYSNYSNLKTGRILAIIGVILNVLSLAFYVYIISAIGLEGTEDPAVMQQKIRELLGQ